MTSSLIVAPADGFEAVPPNVKFADLLIAGPQSIASLSMVLLTASAHDDFPLANKRTTPSHPDSFKMCIQQVVSETHNAYLENDKAFNALRLTLAQAPQLIDYFLATLNKCGPEELRYLGQNALNSVSKLLAKAVYISEQAEKNFNNLLALIQELLSGVLPISGQTLQSVVRRKALKRFEEVPKIIPTGWTLASDANGQRGVATAQEISHNIANRHPGGRKSANNSASNFLPPSQVPKTQAPLSKRGPALTIVQYLWKAINSYQRHTAQVKQVTQLLRSAQIVTDKAAPFESLSNSDSQKGIVIQQAKDVLAIVNAVNRVVTVYVRISKDYTLTGQRRLCKIPYRDTFSSR